jgi:hypothetical protein
LTAVSGRKMPVEVFASALTRWTRIRSRRGAMERIDLMADYGRVSFTSVYGGELAEVSEVQH